MRHDMNKVLTERPRKGWYTKTPRGNKPRVREYVDEDSYSRELRPRRVQQSKWFDDHLGPLRRWLRKQVNRPWDKVWSELAGGIDSRTVTGRHLLDHVRWEVAINCRIDADGMLCAITSWGGIDTHEVKGLYVHPRTGLLRWKKPVSRRVWRAEREDWLERERAPEDAIPSIRVADRVFLVQFRGIWYEADVEQVDWTKIERTKRVDFRHRREPYVVVSKRQLSGRELKERGLRNTDVAT